MSIKRLHVGPRLSQVAIHGDTVYTAGIVADDTNVDVAGQTGQILDKIDQYLNKPEPTRPASCRPRSGSRTSRTSRR